MVNTYFKHLNTAINNSANNDVILNIQNDLTGSAKLLNNSIEELTNIFINNQLNKNLDINSLLKYYLLNQILKNEIETNKKNEIEIFNQTSNPKIFKHKESGKYYWYKNDNYELDENIEEVNEDGSYNKIKKVQTSAFKLRYHYSIENKIKDFQLLNSENSVIKNKWQVVEILNLRKEFVNRYKYSGFSGNSSDIIASFMNKLHPPIESGLYMDKQYNLYKWQSSDCKFVLVNNQIGESALLTDYCFENKGIVIRKEYTGIR